MMDENLIEELRERVFSEAGLNISKDDPIFLNVVLLQCLFQSHIENSQKLTDSIIGNNLGKMDEIVKSCIVEIQKSSSSSIQNFNDFLNALEQVFEEIKISSRNDSNDHSDQIRETVSSSITPLLYAILALLFIGLAAQTFLILRV